jgi:hypothetical protein
MLKRRKVRYKSQPVAVCILTPISRCPLLCTPTLQFAVSSIKGRCNWKFSGQHYPTRGPPGGVVRPAATLASYIGLHTQTIKIHNNLGAEESAYCAFYGSDSQTSPQQRLCPFAMKLSHQLPRFIKQIFLLRILPETLVILTEVFRCIKQARLTNF